MAPTRVIRDPDKISTNRAENFSGEVLAQDGVWELAQLIEMDARFAAAMMHAGYALTQPSSRPGTRSPILGYRRADT